MISKEELTKFRELVEAFTDPDNQEYAYIDPFVSTNSTVIDICASLVEQGTETMEEETEVCYTLLRALCSSVISTRSPLPPVVIRRADTLLNRLPSSLRKAQICSYLYCLSTEDEYKENAKKLLNEFSTKAAQSDSEERIIKDCRLIIGDYSYIRNTHSQNE